MGTFISYLHKLYCVGSNRDKLTSLQRLLHNTCMFAVICTSIFDMLHAAGSMITNTPLLGAGTVQWVTLMEILADIFYYFNSLLLYFILIHRLYRTFDKSSYSISRRVFQWIGFQMLLQLILMTIYLLNLAVHNCETTKWCKRLGITAALIMANDYILNAILFTMFLRKLKQLVESQLTSSMSDMSLSQAMDHRNHRRLLNLITKQSVIGTFVIIFNQMFATCIFIIFAFEGSKFNAKSDLGLVRIAYILRAVEGIFICVLLYFGLAMNEKDYHRFCRCCHKACFSIVRKTTTRNVERSFSVLNMDYVELEDEL